MNREDEIFLKKLTVDTLKVYNFLLRHNPKEVTLEQLSLGLGLSKPTILHHLEKLKSLNIVEQTLKGYRVKEVVKIEIIKGYRHLFRKLLLTWVPLIFIFLCLAIISFITLNQWSIQLIIVILCAFGVLISIKEIKQLM